MLVNSIPWISCHVDDLFVAEIKTLPKDFLMSFTRCVLLGVLLFSFIKLGIYLSVLRSSLQSIFKSFSQRFTELAHQCLF